MFDLHIHSYYSDGQGDIEDIVIKAKERGMKIIAIADHSIEHPLGLTEGKAKRRSDEIEFCRSKYRIKVLDAVECGIDHNGDIYLPNHKFDLIIASIHECLPAEEYCKRIIKCIKKHEFHVLGHFHSSVFNSYTFNEELDLEVIDLLKENNIALEINTAHKAPPPELIDLLGSDAKKLIYSVGSDSHSLSRVGDVSWAFDILNNKVKNWKSIIPTLNI